MPFKLHLQPKQLQFVQLYMVELHKSKPDYHSAVRNAGYKCKPTEAFSRLMKNKRIKAEIDRRCKLMTARVQKTTAELVEDLERNNQSAYEKGKIAESTKAIEVQLRVLGAFVDKVELSGKVNLGEALAMVEERKKLRLAEEGSGED